MEKKKIVSASEQAVLIPLVPRAAVVEVDLALVHIAPQVEGVRDAIVVTYVQQAIWFKKKLHIVVFSDLCLKA